MLEYTGIMIMCEGGTRLFNILAIYSTRDTFNVRVCGIHEYASTLNAPIHELVNVRGMREYAGIALCWPNFYQLIPVYIS